MKDWNVIIHDVICNQSIISGQYGKKSFRNLREYKFSRLVRKVTLFLDVTCSYAILYCALKIRLS